MWLAYTLTAGICHYSFKPGIEQSVALHSRQIAAGTEHSQHFLLILCRAFFFILSCACCGFRFRFSIQIEGESRCCSSNCISQVKIAFHRTCEQMIAVNCNWVCAWVCLDLIKLTGFGYIKVVPILRLPELSLIGIESLQALSIYWFLYLLDIFNLQLIFS